MEAREREIATPCFRIIAKLVARPTPPAAPERLVLLKRGGRKVNF